MKLSARADRSILWRGVHPANRPRWQDDGAVLLTIAGSGLSSSASCERLLPAGSWRRTLSESLLSNLAVLTGSALSLRLKATKSGRGLLAPTTLERRTVASGCGLSAGGDWPTPTRPYGNNRGGAAGRVGPTRPGSEGAARLWPTPIENDATGSTHCYSQGDHSKRALKLPGAVKWATRLASEAGPHDRVKNSTNGKRQDWLSPKASDGRAKGVGGRDGSKGLNLQIGGALNPRWVVQLMGFPDDWLQANPPCVAPDSARSGTRSSRRSRR